MLKHLRTTNKRIFFWQTTGNIYNFVGAIFKCFKKSMSCRNTRNQFCVILDFRRGVNEVHQVAVHEALVNDTVTALNPVSYVYTHTHIQRKCANPQNIVI